MEKQYYLDSKVTIWTRSNFSVEGETEEECNRKMVEYAQRNGNHITNESYEGENGVTFYENEVLYETEEFLTPEDNGDQSTIELIDVSHKGGDPIWTNKMVKINL